MTTRFARLADRVRRVVAETRRKLGEDRCLGLAAQLGFYFALSVFPSLLFFAALVGFLPLEGLIDRLFDGLTTVAPSSPVTLLREQLEELGRDRQPALLTIGMLGAVWSSSAAMVATINALNIAYEVGEPRRWYRRRFVALGLTLMLMAFAAVALALIFISPAAMSRVATWVGLDSAVPIVWAAARWPVMVGLIVIGLDLVYRIAPNRPARWHWVTPGAVVAAGVWFAASFGLKFYAANLGRFNATYGAIGGLVVLLLWSYLSGFAILLGGELNGAIERTAPAARANRGDVR